MYIGIGKFIIDTDKSVSFNIPHLHFIVSSEESFYEASNLEFGLVAMGKTENEAIEKLLDMTMRFIVTTLAMSNGFDELTSIAVGNFTESLWQAYRRIEFNAAKQKKDIGHSFLDQIRNDILRQYGLKTHDVSFFLLEGELKAS